LSPTLYIESNNMTGLTWKDEQFWKNVVDATLRSDVENWINVIHSGNAIEFEWMEDVQVLPIVCYMDARTPCQISMSEPPPWLMLRMILAFDKN